MSGAVADPCVSRPQELKAKAKRSVHGLKDIRRGLEGADQVPTEKVRAHMPLESLPSHRPQVLSGNIEQSPGETRRSYVGNQGQNETYEPD